MKHTLFDTELGTCGLAWSERGIACLELPAATADETRERLIDRVPDSLPAAPEDWVREVIGRIAAHLGGRAQDLSDVPLDLAGLSAFQRRVCEATRTIAPGSTATYGKLAALAGSPGAARAVGQVMANNRLPILVPCHRVLAAGGRVGGFTAPGGLVTKRRLLAGEGVRLRCPGETGSLFEELPRPGLARGPRARP